MISPLAHTSLPQPTIAYVWAGSGRISVALFPIVGNCRRGEGRWLTLNGLGRSLRSDSRNVLADKSNHSYDEKRPRGSYNPCDNPI